MTPTRLALATLALLALSACAPQRTTPPPATPLRSQALIDSGNVAFKAKDFDAAARRYASAVAIQPDDPAAYYGLGMALSRLGRDDEAREAYAKARALMGRSGDSLAPSH
jgi:Flp pilus assembly protein TadD